MRAAESGFPAFSSAQTPRPRSAIPSPRVTQVQMTTLRCGPTSQEDTARRTLPPSSGPAGSRLKTPWARLMPVSKYASAPPNTLAQVPAPSARSKLASGPARATMHSSR